MANPTVANDPHSISQGNIQNVSDLVFGTPTGDAVTITSALTLLPVMDDKEFFEIRNHPQSTNNGLYQVDDAAPAAGTIDVRKVSGADPVVDGTGRDCDILATLITAVSDMDWNNASTDTVDVVSALTLIPTMEIGERFEIRDAVDAENNGGYEVLSTVTNGYNCQKLTGANPSDAVAEAATIYTERKSIFWDTAGLGISVLEQPGLVTTAVADAVWGTPSGAVVGVTSATNALPAVKIGQKVLVTDHITGANNGYYVIRNITTVSADWTCEMVSDGLTPAGAAAEALNIQTDPLVDDTGVLGQPLYSRAMIDWKDDNFLRNNAAFPMFNIDSDAGKYLVGQDASGNNSGWNFVENTEFGIRSRKLVRNMGWEEINSNGLTTAIWAAIRSNSTVEDNDRDLAYYQFGTNTAVDDTVDFEMAGPVDESIQVYDATVTRAGTDFAFASAGDTITRTTGDYIADGYKVGGRCIVSSAENPANDGTRTITALTTTIMTVEELDGTATSFTLNADDVAAEIAIDNRFAFSLKLRPRDDDTNGKSFAQQGLADALATQLSNRAFVFGLGTVEDSDITNTDATVDAYGVTITLHASGQSKGGATLVGGAQLFGIVINGNNKTKNEIYEAIQRLLRQATDADLDASSKIGRALDGLVRFNGTTLEFGSVDGGLSFPSNPDGGGVGVYCDNVASADANNVKFWDNTGVLRSNLETIAITLDFNDILVNDTVAEADLYYDRTIDNLTTTSDIFINSGGTITSATNGLPVLNAGDGQYVRIEGLTGADSAMNGVYQVVTETSTATWTVTRYDGAAMVTTGGTENVTVNEYPFDTPDAIIVDTNNKMSETTISYTTPATIGDSGAGMGIFSVGDSLRIASSDANDGLIVKVLTNDGTTMTIEQSQFDPILATVGSGTSITLTQIASVDADTSTFAFNYDFDGNVQGGRTISETAYIKAKAVGRETAQYTESSVLTIQTNTPRTVPLQSQQERNVSL